MARCDEGALICDMAETYHIFNWRALPGRLAATLAAGLRDNSRIKTIMSGSKIPLETVLQANIADCLRILVWRQTEDGIKGRNAPALFTETLSGDSVATQNEGFSSSEGFMAWRKTMIGGGTDG